MLQQTYRLFLMAGFCLVIFLVISLDILPSKPAMLRRQNGPIDYIRSRADVDLRTVNMGKANPSFPTSPYQYKFHKVEDIKRFVRLQLQQPSSPTFMQLTRKNYLINCSNVDEIEIGKMLGHGKYKTTYIGTFRGVKVAVKVVTRRFGSSNDCAKTILANLQNASLSAIKDTIFFTRCKHNSPLDSMVFEIVNHAVLDFPNIVKNLGYCVRDVDANSTDNTILSQGLISVFEFGDPFCLNHFSNRPFLEKVFHCRELANLLEMSEHSIVGSMGYADMHDRHFMLVNGRVKVIDLDTYVTPVETKCGPISDIPFRERMKKRKRQRYCQDCSSLRVNVSCVDGLCAGANAKDNMFTFTKFFFAKMLEYDKVPPDVVDKIWPFLDDMNYLKLNATQLKEGFDILLTGNFTLYDEVWGSRVREWYHNFIFQPQERFNEGDY